MTSLIRRRTLTSTAALTALALATGVALLPKAHAQAAWPNKPVRIVVPFAPGGTTDILARALVPDLSAAFGQQFVVDNRAGAGGNVGADIVAKAPADGYTLLMGTVGTHGINRALYARLPFDPIKDFVPITLVAAVPNVMVMNADKAKALGIANVQDFIRVAKASPGKLNMASSGNGTSIHLAGELFKSQEKVQAAHVPYASFSQSVPDLLSNRVQFMFMTSSVAVPLVNSGKVRALGIVGPNRLPILPNVATLAEQGMGKIDTSSWDGIVVKAGTPRAIVDRLNTEIVRILDKPEVKARFVEMGMQAVSSTPEELGALIESETVRWAGVIKAANISAD